MKNFKIHPQLLIDCHRLGRFDLCHLLLHKNGAMPWFILVPVTDVGDLFDMPVKLRMAAMHEAAVLDAFVKNILGYPKTNFAAIGNLVPQLHLQLVGRKPDDACWPAPVWGHLTAGPEYSAARLKSLILLLAQHCALHRIR